MAAPDHPTEEESVRIATGIEAADELTRITPELHAGILSALRRVESHMLSNSGVLDPNLAVQAWYQVMAEDKVAKRLGKLMKLGSAAASSNQTRQNAARSLQSAS